MKIGEKKFVSLSYELTVDGVVVDSATAENPMAFVFGAGFLLPKFEENVAGLKAGDKFAFVLDAANGYGEVIPEALVELPKEVFMVDGEVEAGILDVGNQLPMSDNQGNRMIGTVKEVTDSIVMMDFNHPMAGKVLNFSGEVVGVRQSTDEDLMMGMPQGEGCDCGSGGCGDGGCGDGGCSDKGCGCN